MQLYRSTFVWAFSGASVKANMLLTTKLLGSLGALASSNFMLGTIFVLFQSVRLLQWRFKWKGEVSSCISESKVASLLDFPQQFWREESGGRAERVLGVWVCVMLLSDQCDAVSEAPHRPPALLLCSYTHSKLCLSLTYTCAVTGVRSILSCLVLFFFLDIFFFLHVQHNWCIYYLCLTTSADLTS